MDAKLRGARRTPVVVLWTVTAVVLVAAWIGLAFAPANTVYVLAAVILTIWLPAFTWWYTRRDVTGSLES